ncbi:MULTISPECIES: dTDP-4-dehydrorhamnose 3,5-epimerase [unclassified Polaribacter]|uniref:dTDP-4-dehydrorhamnose 3,5-epimerase n=1 Tax=unclassified Polaribacter TaxID=196858 RepID=UPI0011BD8391|nr:MULTISPECIES: dTDP-4-dehydrorhamnose 3,5-epimerase [unclassified Polaribacter]TXD54239.1 dTDP-4-dehydrorhamnose 3,5-epimerase [Polaribacter sp. IC063]TXD57119.1 dTDP-4-dehydrorhamnose 3,5-epimerase [Polaribacter sp. IC066]
MKVTEINLKGIFVIEPRVFGDGRGSFFESFNQKSFKEKTGLKINFVQDNQSLSQKGVVRGLHIQQGKFAQTKLVRVIQGKQDVVVNVGKNSETFGQSFSCLLSSENNKQLFISKGFLHGFSVLEDATIFAYKCDQYYNKESEDGVVFNDKDLNIDWMIDENEMILSEKDLKMKRFKEYCI